METKHPGRVVRVEIIVDAEDPTQDESLNRAIRMFGEFLCEQGHANIMCAESLTPREERKEETRPARPVDPNLN
jgi:hypothetical protein